MAKYTFEREFFGRKWYETVDESEMGRWHKEEKRAVWTALGIFVVAGLIIYTIASGLVVTDPYNRPTKLGYETYRDFDIRVNRWAEDLEYHHPEVNVSKETSKIKEYKKHTETYRDWPIK